MELSYSVYVIIYHGFEFGHFECNFFGNFGLYWWVPEGRNMSTIKDEEILYQNCKKSLIDKYISKIYIDTFS